MALAGITGNDDDTQEEEVDNKYDTDMATRHWRSGIISRLESHPTV